MDVIYSFLKTVLDFLVRIVELFVGLVIYVLNFLLDLLRSLASSV